MAVTTEVVAAYSALGGRWQRGPGPIYDRLAETVVACAPAPLAGERVLDVGAGTGAASRAALAAGAAEVVAVDAAWGMLAHDAGRRAPAVVGDCLALPFAARSFGAAVAAFSLNHVADAAAGLREMARVTRPGGSLVAASYAGDDHHPVKEAVEDELAARGWTPEPWFGELRATAIARLATAEGIAGAAAAAGVPATVEAVRVAFPDLDHEALVAWRLDMAQYVAFVDRLSEEDRRELASAVLARIAGSPPLVRSILVARASVPE